jgi:hypothetical protein
LKLASVSLPKACSLLSVQIVVAFSPSPFLLIVSVTARLLPSSIVAALEVGERYPLASAT